MPGTLISPYTDNKPTPAVQADAGIKISKPGYSATSTAGANMVFNSSWPSLPIAFEKLMDGPATSTPIPHGLTYAPFSMIWYTYNDPSGIGVVAGRAIAYNDTTNVYIPNIPYTVIKLKVRAFKLDLNRDIDYTLAPGDTYNMPYDKNYGFKAAKYTKSIDSTDMRDFTMHSRCQSPLILAVKTQATVTTPNVVQYTTKLNYPVWVYGFIKAGTSLATSLGVPVNTYISAPYYSQSYPRIFTDGFLSYLPWTAGANADNGATIVVLRDPMFAAQQVTVQY